MPQFRLARSLPLLLLLGACVDDPTAAVREPEPRKPAPRVLGVYEFTLTGIGTSDMRASVQAVPAPGQTLSPAPSGVSFEVMTAARMTHGVRGQGGQRYFSFTYRVRNMSGAALTNLTFIPVIGGTSIGATPFTGLKLVDGTNADPAIAPRIVPAGWVNLTDAGGLRSAATDVLQVFDESEVAAVTLPSAYTGIFPYGFVARNPATPGSRTLPSTTDANEFAGAVTFSFRHPLQATSAADPNSITFNALAVEDTETRITESIEEGQDTSAIRQIRERAAALGATTVTVLAGSSALDPAVPDYPGQRQICSVRTAGTAGAATNYVTEPAGYAQIRVLRPGESLDACGAYFRGGTPGRPATNVPFSLTAYAIDLYGNLKTTAVDSVRLESVSGPAATIGPRAALVSGQATIQVTYTAYGSSLLRAVGRRNRGLQAIGVAGVTRTWTGNVSTDPNTPANWNTGGWPGAQDTVSIPAGRPFYPVLPNNAALGGVIVDAGATVDLATFDLTASQNVWADGAISSTTGRLILTGLNKSVRGNLPRMQVTGTYQLNGAVASRARVELAGGRLRTTGFRLRTTSE